MDEKHAEKNGKLTSMEKYAVKGMLLEKMGLSKIRNLLGRGSNTALVSYLRREGIKIKGSVIIYSKFRGEPNGEPNGEVNDEINPATLPVKYNHQAVLSKLDQAGIHGEDARRLINKALLTLKDETEVSDNQVYNEAIRNVGPRELMIREGVGGTQKGNVAIMTAAAAQIGDRNSSEEQSGQSRSTRGDVFKPNG